MDEASLDPDPMTQLSRWLEVARAAGEPMPEAMAVATATTDGRPSSRMVLLRGIDHRGLVFYTDRESDKGRELSANPFAAALFHWFLPLHRQVGVTGAVEEVDDDQSDAYWRSRPPGARRSAVASHQSEVVVSRAVLEERVAELVETFPDETGPPRPPLGHLLPTGVGVHERSRLNETRRTQLDRRTSQFSQGFLAKQPARI